MKFVCLIHGDDADRARETSADAHFDYVEELRRRGHFIHAETLQLPASATIVRMRNGCLSMADGPFIPSKESLNGFIVIEARDLYAAIRIAAGMPAARHGPVEVRPVQELTRIAATAHDGQLKSSA